VAQLKQIVAGAFAQFEREAVMNRAEPETGTLLGSLGLSEREAEVAAAIVEGKTNREISRVLFISLRTVEKHVQRIFSHFGISSRNKLASKLRDCKSLRESESANPFRQGAVPRTRRLR
jgi:DNA-binding NarL/FixJ family response regulator